MNVEETFYRRREVVREPRVLPAATYNLAHVLLTRSKNECLFVPIRSMQYLAVLDAQEFIFVDREGGRMIDIAWQRFRPSERTALDEPVAYEAVYYSDSDVSTKQRLQGEFHKALLQLEQRAPLTATARVIKLPVQGH